MSPSMLPMRLIPLGSIHQHDPKSSGPDGPATGELLVASLGKPATRPGRRDAGRSLRVHLVGQCLCTPSWPAGSLRGTGIISKVISSHMRIDARMLMGA